MPAWVPRQAKRGRYNQPDGSWVKEKATHIPEKMFDIVGVEPDLDSGMRGSAGRRWALGAKPHKRGNGTMQVDRRGAQDGVVAAKPFRRSHARAGPRVSQTQHRSTGESRFPFGSRYQGLPGWMCSMARGNNGEFEPET